MSPGAFVRLKSGWGTKKRLYSALGQVEQRSSTSFSWEADVSFPPLRRGLEPLVLLISTDHLESVSALEILAEAAK